MMDRNYILQLPKLQVNFFQFMGIPVYKVTTNKPYKRLKIHNPFKMTYLVSSKVSIIIIFKKQIISKNVCVFFSLILSSLLILFHWTFANFKDWDNVTKRHQSQQTLWRRYRKEKFDGFKLWNVHCLSWLKLSWFCMTVHKYFYHMPNVISLYCTDSLSRELNQWDLLIRVTKLSQCPTLVI